MTKKRILYNFAIFFIGILSLMAISGKAHNPSSMSLSYDSNTEILSVSIKHTVNNPNSHFIESVEIKLNGSTIINQPYTSQPSTSTFTYQYNITAGVGATIQAIATCNQIGSITRSIIVGDDSGGQDGTTEIPGYLGFLIITTLALIILLPLIYRKIKIRIT
ncbi:MAG: hypothetical protein ACFE91_16375 [Promethearchaeota archaeon]